MCGSVVDTAVGLPEPDFFSQYLAPLDDNSDNTISISLLPDHNSILPNPGWSANVLPGIALGENVDVWTTDSKAIPFQQHVQADGDLSERYEALLVEFCESSRRLDNRYQPCRTWKPRLTEPLFVILLNRRQLCDTRVDRHVYSPGSSWVGRTLYGDDFVVPRYTDS
jgi:hypothetical protein